MGKCLVITSYVFCYKQGKINLFQLNSILLNIFLVSLRRILTLTALFALYTWKLPHIFWHCSFVKKLWYDVSVFISEKVGNSLTLFCLLKM